MIIKENILNNGWHIIKFSDCIKQLNTGLNPRNNFSLGSGKLKYITAKNLTKFGTIDFSKCDFIDEDAKKIIHKRSDIRRGDILFSSRAPIGHCHLITEDPDFYDIGESIFSIRVNQDVALPEYLCLYLASDYFVKVASKHTTGSIIMEIRISDLMNTEIIIPPREIQKNIAKCLNKIDRKIELNKMVNDNLEQQAATYFQELFINNANPVWQISTISDLGTVVGGSTPSKTKPEYYTNNGIAWITPKDLSINKSKFISHGENDITELGLKNSSATVMPKGTVLFSSRAPIGYIAIASNEVTTNQGFKSVIPYSEIGTAFVYFFLKHSLPVIESAASGSTFKEISGSAMKNIPAIIPDRNTLDQFNSFCAPIFAQQKILEEQNHSLAMLRDSLLPKLMSGAIDIASIQL